MLFEDIFYPDNPKRRDEIRNYQAGLINALQQYKGSWNGLVTQINPILKSAKQTDGGTKYNTIEFQQLEYDVKNMPISTCIEKINSAGQNMKAQLEKMFNDIGLPSLPTDEDLKTKDIAGIVHFYIAQLPSLIIDTVAVAALTTAIVVSFRLLALFAQLSTVTIFLTSALMSVVFGGVAFILTDMIVSAITGAIERSQLEDAISVYRQADENITQPLIASAGNMAGISQCLKDGLYKLNEDTILRRKKDGVWVIIDLS